MNDRETLERHYEWNNSRSGTLAAAIRSVLKELAETNEALAACQSSGGWLKEENERLRAELYDRPGSKQDWVDRCYGVEARLDAALKIAEGASLQTTSASVIGEIVTALKGEA